jgi:signal transduction histidine kinase
MPEIVWYRSFYWRIALGFVALLAVLLAVQGALFLWLTGRASELLPGRSPEEYAQTIAADLATHLAERPDLDVDAHLHERYQTSYRAFAVAMRDGSIVSSRRVPPPPELGRSARGRLLGPGRGGGRGGPPPIDPPPPARRPAATGEPGASVTPEPGTAPPAAPAPVQPGLRGEGDGRGRGVFDRGRDGFGRGRGGGSPLAAVYAPVVVNNETVAMVGVLREPRPLSSVVRDLGPALGIVAVGLLGAGTAIAALMIFRPTHRRLRSLQDAARAIGAGEEGVRATATGGDEVAILAQAFNEMAGGLEQRSQALSAADESRRQLLADVSHELMTPLSAIRGYVETMAMPDLALDAGTRQRYLQIVSDETERMEHIIGDLLDLARLEGGAGTWKREPVDVAALFERIQHRHDPALARRHITLEREISPGVDVVTGDANRLEQALQNLAANAVRHTPEGGRIRLAASRTADGVRITVQDSGPGIPEEHLARVFDRFYKVDTSRTGTALPSGSGLGLSIVQAIVRRHGGHIDAGNVPGGGARFTIVLPDAEVVEGTEKSSHGGHGRTE